MDGFSEVWVDAGIGNITNPPVFEIGRNKYAFAENFRRLKGHIDDLKIWNRAKDPCEVFSERNSENSGLENGLFANYKFDISSDTLYDCSPNKRHGSRAGSSGPNNKTQFSTDRPSLTDVDCGVQIVGTDDDALLGDAGTLQVKLSPNPVEGDILSVELNTDAPVIAQVFSTTGALLHETILQGRDSHLKTTGLAAGAYILRFAAGHEVVVEKITKF